MGMFSKDKPKADGKGKPGDAKPGAKPNAMFGKTDVSGKGGSVEQQLNNISRRLRLLEERYANVRKKMQAHDQHYLKHKKEMKKHITVLTDELTGYKRDFMDLRDKTRLIVKELKDCAKSDEVMVLQNYLDLWEPMKFVTQNQIDRIVEEKLEDMGIHQAGVKMMHEAVKEDKKVSSE